MLRSSVVLLCGITLLILATGQEECINLLQGQLFEDSVETGSFGLVRGGQERVHQYDVSLSQLTGNFEIAISIIYISNYKQPGGLDFHITTTIRPNVNTGFTAFLFIHNTTLWTNTHVHFLVSNSPELRAGSFVADSTELLQFSPSFTAKNVTQVHEFITEKAWDQNTLDVSVRIFLSGIRTEDANFKVQIDSRSIQYEQSRKTLMFVLSISGAQNPIESINLCYIMYSENQGININTIPESIEQLVINSIEDQAFAKSRIFTGMNGVNGEELSKLNSRRRFLASSLDTNDKQILSIWTKSFLIRSVKIENIKIVGNEAILTRTRDEAIPDLDKLIQQGICLTRENCLESGGQFYGLRNSQFTCVKCKQNKDFNIIEERCICRQGFIEKDGECKTEAEYCGEGNRFINNACYRLTKISEVCSFNEEYNQTTEKCQCKENHERDALRNICIPRCRADQLFDFNTLQCICQQNSQMINSFCRKCEDSQTYNRATRTCDCFEGLSKTLDGSCIRCSSNSEYREALNRCVCKEGYIGNGIICRPSRSSTTIVREGSGTGLFSLNIQP